MKGIYTYIPETNYVPREYSVAASLLLLFMVLISVSVLNLLYFYISTFRSMCTVPNMAIFCSFLTSCFPGMLLMYFLNDFEIVPVAPIIIIIIIIVPRVRMQGAVPPLHIRLYGMHKGFSLLMIAYMMWIYGIDLSSSRRGPVRLSRQGKGTSCFINVAFEQSRDYQSSRLNQLPTTDGHQSMALLSVVHNWCENSILTALLP